MATSDNGLPIIIEFGGGAELLFDKKKRYEVNLPGHQEWTLQKLLHWLKDNLLTEREELFIQENTVRPGILVLVNDADWELLGILALDRLDFVMQSRWRKYFENSIMKG